MSVLECNLQQKLDNILKEIKDNNCYLDEDNKVHKSSEVFVVTIQGTFYDEYIGDSDWHYRDVNGDIIINNEQAKLLINNIFDVNDDYEEVQIVKASETITEILTNEDYSFRRLYCCDCGEFYNVLKGNDFIEFSDRVKNEWNFQITIQKKQKKDIEKFDISETKVGCF